MTEEDTFRRRPIPDAFEFFHAQLNDGRPIHFSPETKNRLLSVRDRQFRSLGELAVGFAREDGSDVVVPQHLDSAIQAIAAMARTNEAAVTRENRLLITGYGKGAGSALLAIGIPLLAAVDPTNASIHPTFGWGLACCGLGLAALSGAIAADVAMWLDRPRTRPRRAGG